MFELEHKILRVRVGEILSEQIFVVIHDLKSDLSGRLLSNRPTCSSLRDARQLLLFGKSAPHTIKLFSCCRFDVSFRICTKNPWAPPYTATTRDNHNENYFCTETQNHFNEKDSSIHPRLSSCTIRFLLKRTPPLTSQYFETTFFLLYVETISIPKMAAQVVSCV